MLLILDQCSIGVRKEPQGGIVFVLSEIQGLPDTNIMVPIEGKDRAQELIDGVQETIGPRVHTANLQDLKGIQHGS